MKRVWTTIAITACCLASLGADVTIVQTMTMEGAMAAAMGGQEPRIVMKIKGNKARTEADVMGNTMVSIADLDAGQMIVLNSASKTAQVITADPAAKGGAAAAKGPDADLNFKATGNKRTIDGVNCDDHSFSLSMDMAQFSAGQQLPPEAAEMMKGVKINAEGVTCIAREGKGIADFSAYQKAAASSGLMSAALGSALGGGGKPGASAGGGMDKLMSAVSSAPGLPYITEITMTIDGTGPMADMLKQMGPMKITQKITSVTTDSLSEDLFKVPADYKVEKK